MLDHVRTPPYTPLMQRIAIHEFFYADHQCFEKLAKPPHKNFLYLPIKKAISHGVKAQL